MKLFKYSFLAVAFAAFSSLASANIVTPGGTVLPDILSVGGSPNILATTYGIANAPTFSAGYFEAVVRDSQSNLVCPSGGCLDFFVGVMNMGPGNDTNHDWQSIEHVTLSSFASAQTDVGVVKIVDPSLVPSQYQSQFFSAIATGAMPTNVTRTSDGQVVGFNFLASDAIGHNQWSDLLEIQTDQQNYTSGFLSFQDGSTVTVSGFGVTPEPQMVGILSLASLALVFAARRFKNTSTNLA